MVVIKTIDSFDHPSLIPYRTMKMQQDHHNQGIFVAEGEKIVRRLIETDFRIISVLLPGKWLAEFQKLLEPRTELIEVFVAEKEVLERLTGFSMYQGILAVARIPRPWSLESVVAASRSPRLLVATDGINNSENMGILVRNCAAFGTQALIIGETSSSPYMRRAVRTSMGTIFKLPYVECNCLAYTLRLLNKCGIKTVAAHPHSEKRYISQVDLTGDVCIVFGSEGEGISSEVLEACAEWAEIEMSPGVDSLNVGSSAAVVLYEVWRQRFFSKRHN
ncbi:MAG: TrmH family RNA methyltransferase [Limisphaerales bacterium]|jgi:tRNA G18 (ribose-2'-O)-methylase SpoU